MCLRIVDAHFHLWAPQAAAGAVAVAARDDAEGGASATGGFGFRNNSAASDAARQAKMATEIALARETGADWSWIAGGEQISEHFAGNFDEIRRPYLRAEYAAEAESSNGAVCVCACVHVQAVCNDPLVETRWLVAAEGPRPEAIVAFVDLAGGDADAIRRDLAQQVEAAQGRLRGIRQMLNYSTLRPDLCETSTDLLESDTFLSNVGLLSEFKLSFDLQVWWSQLSKAADKLVRRLPGVQFVVNHAGLPPGDLLRAAGDRGDDSGTAAAEALAEWRAGIRALAACENCTIKLSGLVMTHHLRGMWGGPTPRTTLGPYVSFILQEFGPDRCMFASNFPVDKLQGRFGDLFRLYSLLADDAELSEEDKQKVFHDNALRVYRIMDHSCPPTDQ